MSLLRERERESNLREAINNGEREKAIQTADSALYTAILIQSEGRK